MAQRVAWTETAWRDLRRIADYIAEDSPGYAAALVRRVRDRARSLEEMAERGRVVPELEEQAPKAWKVGGGAYPSHIEPNRDSSSPEKHSIKTSWKKTEPAPVRHFWISSL